MDAPEVGRIYKMRPEKENAFQDDVFTVIAEVRKNPKGLFWVRYKMAYEVTTKDGARYRIGDTVSTESWKLFKQIYKPTKHLLRIT